jgi:hypothetical protein
MHLHQLNHRAAAIDKPAIKSAKHRFSDPNIDSQPLNAGRTPAEGREEPASSPAEPRLQADKEFRRRLFGVTADPAAAPIGLTSIERKILADLKPQSPLDELPPARQSELFDLMEDFSGENVLKAITRPEPDGWGIQTSERSLYRFQKRYRQIRQLEKLKELEATRHDPVAFAKAADQLLNDRLFETLINPKSKTSEVRDLYQSHLRRILADLATQRLTLKRKNVQ